MNSAAFSIIAVLTLAAALAAATLPKLVHDGEIAIIKAARQLTLARDETRREIRFHLTERPPRDGTSKRQ